MQRFDGKHGKSITKFTKMYRQSTEYLFLQIVYLVRRY